MRPARARDAPLALVVLPVLRRTLNVPAPGRVIPAVERRALPLIPGSIGVAPVTGMCLLFAADRILGLGRFSGSTRSTLIVARHGVVIAPILGAIVAVLTAAAQAS
jgi:hypothetical protein